MIISSSAHQRTRGFSLTELLVVIAIIAILASLVLAVVVKARDAGREAATMGTMQAFKQACEAFRAEHGYYPGVVPESTLANHISQSTSSGGRMTITGMENALLHLLGGYVLETEVTQDQYDDLAQSGGWVEYQFLEPGGDFFRMKVNRNQIGEGPTIDGVFHQPYFNPANRDLIIADGNDSPGLVQWGMATADESQRLPDLVDGWGTPIIYIRQARTRGPLTEIVSDPDRKPRFYEECIWPHVNAQAQVWVGPCGDGSILSSDQPGGAGGGFDELLTGRGYALLLRAPIGTESALDQKHPGTPSGAMMLVSAGADGIYFSAIDGPGSPMRPIGSSGGGGCDAYPYADGGFLQDADDEPVIPMFDDLIMSGSNY